MVKKMVKKMRKKVMTAIALLQVLASYLIRDHVCYTLLADIN
jgi:hypothetical protein